MAVIRPFKALRPVGKVAHLVASVPYDVVNREEAVELAKDNPLNFLRVTRSEIELEKSINPYSQDVYKKAKLNLSRLITDAPLITDEEAFYYVYRLKMGDHTQIGIAATFSVEDYNNNIILKHEKTRKVKEDDRTNHIIETEAQTGAVFLTYKGIDEINAVINQTINNNPPVYDFTTPDSIKHTMWIMPTDFNDIIEFEIGKAKNLYIADGHHRAASAARAKKIKQENNPNHTGEEDYNFFLAVIFPAEQLKILPYNRVVLKISDEIKTNFWESIKKNWNIEPTDSSNPPEKKTICMYYESKWYLLHPNENVVPGPSIGDKLDVSILQNFLLQPVFGITDPRTDNNIDFIGGIRGTTELVKLVDSGRAVVAFSMYPLEVDDLINISDAGETMPPKSTWFEPKLRDGMVVHTI